MPERRSKLFSKQIAVGITEKTAAPLGQLGTNRGQIADTPRLLGCVRSFPLRMTFTHFELEREKLEQKTLARRVALASGESYSTSLEPGRQDS